MRYRPGWAVIVLSLAQQKAGQLLASLAQSTDGDQTRAHKVADRLVRSIRNPNRGQFARAVQPGKIDRIPTIRLDPIAPASAG